MTREEEIMQEANTRYSVSHPFIDIAKESFIEGAQWADRTMIEKAFEWLCANMVDNTYLGANTLRALKKAEFIQNFKKAMEE